MFHILKESKENSEKILLSYAHLSNLLQWMKDSADFHFFQRRLMGFSYAINALLFAAQIIMIGIAVRSLSAIRNESQRYRKNCYRHQWTTHFDQVQDALMSMKIYSHLGRASPPTCILRVDGDPPSRYKLFTPHAHMHTGQRHGVSAMPICILARDAHMHTGTDGTETL